MNKFALTIPGMDGNPVEIQAPDNIPTGNYSIGELATAGITVALVFGVVLSLLYLVYGGFFWLQSKGDKQQLDKARRIIIYSIVGLIVMALSLVVVNLIGTALGLESAVGNQ